MEESKICRLCLSTHNVNTDVFTEFDEKSELQTKIWACFSFWVYKDDHLPKSICAQCSVTVQHFHSYLKQVERVQHTLQSAFDEQGNLKDGIIDLHHMKFKEEQELFKQDQDLSILQTDLTPSSVPNDSNSCMQASSKRKQKKPSKVASGKGAGRSTKGMKRSKVKVKQKKKPSVFDSDSDNSLYFNEFVDSDDAASDNELHDDTSINHMPLMKQPKKFPKTILDDCKLLVRGKRLIALVSKFYKLDCNLCEDKPLFKNLTEMFSHYEETHKVKGYVVCCGIQYSKPRAMTMHMARHLQPDAFKCQTCGKLMTCPRILQYHKQNHLPEAERPLACPHSECPRRFSFNSARIAHQISHLPESEREAHVCEECGKTYRSPVRLATHMNIAHVQQQIFICHICSKTFTTRSNFTYHVTTHQPKETSQVMCDECGKWSKNKVCLKKHMELHSSMRLRCHLCMYTTFTSRNMRNHMNVRHSQSTPYVCEICGQAFKVKNYLTTHMNQHTGERRYECEFCSRTFASSGNYYSHRKKMHFAQLHASQEEKRQRERDNRLRQEMQPQEFNLNMGGI